MRGYPLQNPLVAHVMLLICVALIGAWVTCLDYMLGFSLGLLYRSAYRSVIKMTVLYLLLICVAIICAWVTCSDYCSAYRSVITPLHI